MEHTYTVTIKNCDTSKEKYDYICSTLKNQTEEGKQYKISLGEDLAYLFFASHTGPPRSKYNNYLGEFNDGLWFVYRERYRLEPNEAQIEPYKDTIKIQFVYPEGHDETTLLNHTENRSGGKVCVGEENDPCPSHEDENIDWRPFGIHISNQNKHDGKLVAPDDIDVGDIVYMPFIRYFNGDDDTFSRTCGLWEVWELFKTKKEAHENLKIVLDLDYKRKFGGLEDSGVLTFEVEP